MLFCEKRIVLFFNENRSRDAHGEAWSPITLVSAASRPGNQPANEPAAAASAAGAAAAAASQPANEPANERGAAVAFFLFLK